MKKIKELFNYREMLFSTIRKDLSATYRRSVLGTLWIVINPILQLLIYNIVFSEILQVEIDNYIIFLASALIPWIFFSSSVVGGARSVLNSQELVKKIYFPRMIAPISFVTTSFVTMLFSLGAVFLLVFYLGITINFHVIVYLPMIMITEYMFALGIALITSAIMVYFRDMQFILEIITMAWQFLTPVLYSSDFVPQEFLPIWRLNPMTPIIESYRDVIYFKIAPSTQRLSFSLVIGLAGLSIGYLIFNKLQKNFAEEL